MYALSEPPRAMPAPLRVASAPSPGERRRPVRLRPEVYRRRRLTVAGALAVVTLVAVAVASGSADRSIVERLGALVVLTGWVVAAVSLSRWDRRAASSGAGPRASCLALGPAPDTA